MKSMDEWNDLIESILFTTRESKESKPHTRVRMWDFPHHPFDLNVIHNTLDAVKHSKSVEKRSTHPLRSLGLLDKQCKLTEVGNVFLNSKESTQSFIIENQCKKWHYPNITLTRPSSAAWLFNIFPFWVCLKFMYILNEKYNSNVLLPEEAIFTILSIMKYNEIGNRLEFLEDYRSMDFEQKGVILSKLHSKQSLDFIKKGPCFKLFAYWTRYFSIDVNYNLSLNIDVIDEISKILKLFSNLQRSNKLPKWNSDDYLHLLHSKASFERYFSKKEYIDIKRNFPDISETEISFINFEINIIKQPKQKKRIKYLKKYINTEKENKIIGELGESIVLKKEREYLKQNGKIELSKKIQQISKSNIAAGYDILSYELNGQEKFIEVKSKVRSPSKAISFIMTANEYEKGKELKNYYIYIVFDVKTEKPRIWPIKNPLTMEDKGLFFSPERYRVTINIV